MLASIQNEFAAALLDAERAVPASVASWTRQQPSRRFAVYRNNVVASLINALRTRFPATERIVGNDFFAAMAHNFATHSPPRSPVMLWYGEELPNFIAAFEPAREVPYLADVARLEAARTQAYHAADADPLPAEAFARITSIEVLEARVILHPSTRIVLSHYPIVTIWAMNADETELGPVDLTQGEDALVVRPEHTVVVRGLPPGAAKFLSCLSMGHAIGASAERAAEQHSAFDLSAALAILIGSGIVTGLQHPRLEENLP